MAFEQQHQSTAFGQGHMAPQAGVDLRQLLAGVWRRKMLVAGTVAVILSATMAVLVLVTPRYSSEALIMIEDGEASALRRAGEQRAAPPDSLAVQSEVEVLRSRDVAAVVVDKLDLLNAPEFNPAAPGGSLISDILSQIGLGSGPGSANARERVLDAYFSKLSVYAVPNSRVIAVDATSVDPELAARIANTIAETYLDQTREAKFENTRLVAEWLSREIEKLRRRVADAEAAAEQFRARSGLFRGTETTLDRQELSELNTQITVAASARSEAQSRADAIRATLERDGSVERAPEVLNSQLIQRLREQQATLRRQIADLGQTYLPNHPRMKSLNAEMGGLDRQIRSEALKIAAGLEDQARSAGAREQALREKLEKLKTQAALTNQDEVRLEALEREAAANRTLLESFLAQYREATARTDASALPAGARIISRAQPRSTPSFPRTGPMMLLALFASLVLGTALAFIAEMLAAPTPVAAAPVPVEPPMAASPAPSPSAASGAPVLRSSIMPATEPLVAVMPDPPVAPAAVNADPAVGRAAPAANFPAQAAHAAKGPTPTASATVARTPAAPAAPAPRRAFPPLDPGADKTLSERVRRLSSQLSTRRVLVTSVGRNGARPPVVASLARGIAGGRARTLVIDADFTAPQSLARTFEQPADVGLSEVLLGTASFGEAVRRDAVSGAEIVVAGSSSAAAESLLGSDRMDLILSALEQAYDIVIVNGPPATGQDIGKTIARRVWLALIVADDDQNGAEAAALASHVLIAEGVREVLPVHVDGSGTTARIRLGATAAGYGHAA